MSWIVAFSCTLFIFIWFVFTRISDVRKINDVKNRRLPPGPPFLKCLQLFLRVLWHRDLHIVSEELYLKYGDIFIFKFLGRNLVFLNSSQLIKKVFSGAEYRDKAADRPPSFGVKYIFENGQDIGLSDYHAHQIKLKTIMQVTLKYFVDSSKDKDTILNQEIARLVDELAASANLESVDLKQAISIHILRNTHILLTGQYLKEEEKLVEIWEKVIKYFNIMMRLDMDILYSTFPWIRHLPYYSDIFTNMTSSLKQLQDIYMDPLLHEELKGTNCLIGKFLKEQETDSTISDSNLKGIITDTFIGSYGSSKGIILGFMLIMVNYPQVQARIRQEIDEIIGSRCPTAVDVSKLHYTQSVVIECFRYIRHGALGVTHANKTEKLDVEGFRIPINSQIIGNRWVANHNVGEWTDTKQFKPDRFLNEDGQLLAPSHPLRHQFVSFGAGRRMCPGESLVKSRLFLLFTTLLQRFTFHKGDNQLPPEDAALWGNGMELYPPFLNLKLVINEGTG